MINLENKEKFTEFIVKKRKEANLTQKEFADLLYVTDTAVSKWERGKSYPDITLISSICKVLNITEHEFITACDDYLAKVEKKQAKKYRSFVKTYYWSLIIAYGIALLTCFIVNIAVNHTLSWFFIVLVSIALAFSITNLPLILKKHSLFITLGSVTVLIYILLIVCSLYTNGDWLYSIAIPMASIPLAVFWLTVLAIKYLHVNWILKSGLIILFWSMMIIIINMSSKYFVERKSYDFTAYFNLTDWNREILANKIVFMSLSLLGLISIITGIVTELSNREN